MPNRSFLIGLGICSFLAAGQTALFFAQLRTQAALDRISDALTTIRQDNRRGPVAPIVLPGPGNEASLALSTGVTKEDLQAVIRAELAHFSDEVIADDEPPEPPEEPPETVREREEAFVAAERVVSGALSSGTWTARDQEALVAVRGRLSQAQRQELRAELLPQVNAQKVRVEINEHIAF